MNILLIDDSGSTVYYLSEALKEKGHVVYDCFNNYEAIEFLNNNVIDLIIQDLNREPVGLKNIEETQGGSLTGFVFYKEFISKTRPDIPVIFYSAFIDQLRFEEFNTRNRVHFLSKNHNNSIQSIFDIINKIPEKDKDLYVSEFSIKQNLIVKANFSAINFELIKLLNLDPNYLHRLSPNKFEELIAFLLEKSGYEVTLTQKTRDGGKDIYALKNTELGNFLSVVECKKYAPERPVGVSVVRSLYGVKTAERANMGVVMTTSYFSKDAHEFKNLLGTELSLKDYNSLVLWLKEFK